MPLVNAVPINSCPDHAMGRAGVEEYVRETMRLIERSRALLRASTPFPESHKGPELPPPTSPDLTGQGPPTSETGAAMGSQVKGSGARRDDCSNASMSGRASKDGERLDAT
jgi:hypothetical protein